MIDSPGAAGASRAAVLIAALAAAPLAASAQVVYDATDHLWYEAVYASAGVTWNDAAAQATALGGHLATPTDASQDAFVFSLVQDPKYWTGLSIHSDRLGPWLGIYSTTPTSQGETWVYSGSGDALGSFRPWGPNQPDGYGGGYQAVDFYAYAAEGSTWGDTPQGGTAGFPLPTGFVVQFDSAPAAVPEPGKVLMMLAGLAFVAMRLRRS
jgi:hypothetical protein